MKTAETQADTMKNKLSNVGSFMKTSLVAGLAAAGVAIGATIVQGVKATAELDEQLSKFKASTGATAEETEKIRDLSKELFKTNTDSMEDIVATASELKRTMGMNTDEIEKYQQSYMDYAKTTGQANVDVVKAIDKIGDAWGLTAEESTKSLDLLKASSEQFGTNIVEVQSALSKVAPASKALGLSLEETNGVMNLFATSGLDASQSVTAFTYAAKQIESPEQFKTMLADIQAITDPTQKAQKAVELFGAKAGISIANALDGSKNLDDFILTMDEVAGTVSNASDNFDGNFNVQLELMKKQFLGLAQELGEKFMPILNEGLQWVTDKMPIIMSTIEGAIDFIGKLLDPFIQIIKSVITSFQDTETQTDSSFGAIQETISGIIGTIQSIVQTFVELFTIIWEKWGEDIIEFAQNHFQNIMEIIQNTFDIIQGILDFFVALFTGDWEGCWEAVKNILSSTWDLITSIFEAQIDFIKGILDVGFTLLVTLATSLMKMLWEGIKGVWNNIISWFEGIIDNLVAWFGGLGESFTNIGKNMFNWVFDGLKSVWENISKWMSEKVEWLTDKLTFWKKGKDEMSDSTTIKSGSSYEASYAVGTPFVPNDQIALIHKGEALIPAALNPFNPANNLSNNTNVDSGNHSTENYNFGGIVVNNPANFNDFMRQLNQRMSVSVNPVCT